MNGLHDNVRILIIDDDEDDFIITSGYMREVPGNSFTIDWASTYKEGLRQLAANTYDLYFVDYRLGAKSGVDFLKEARNMECEAPIVLLTGQGNHAVDIEAMQLGAVDYLIKAELNNEKIERCIRYALERARTLKALRSSETKYRSIFEKSKDMVFVLDKNLRIIDVNGAITSLLGFERQATLGMSLLEFIRHDEDKQYISEAVCVGKPVLDYATSMTTLDGNKLNCTITLSAENNGKDDVYIQGIIHDITNLKKAEQAAMQSEKLAATGRLVRTLAHEIRNPLNNITMSADHLQKDITDADAGLYLDIIMRSGMRINKLINELLQSANPNDNLHKRYPLQGILDEVVAASADRVTLKKMQSVIIYPPEPIMVMADAENLKLALLNIVINAIESMEEGKGILAITLQSTGGNAQLKIADNGCGISEENISRIFEPYFTRKQNGTGLGLAFTLNILNTHNVELDVSSVVGIGTTFTLTFPTPAP